MSLAPHRLKPRPWRPLTDAEWAELRVWLPHGDPDAPQRGPGRPPRDLRKTVDAIFWVAASHGPWKDLPPELGKPGTAHRTLSRWARAGVLEPLLVKVSHPEAEGSATLRGLAYWLAFPLILPNRDLSKTGWTTLRTVHSALKLNTMLFVRATSRTEREERYKAGRLIIRAARSTWKRIRLGVCGNRHQWRLK
jgi:hypothetical protein